MNTIIFDWKRTLYDPDKKLLIKGTLTLLSTLKEKNMILVLIGKGGSDMYTEVERLGIKDYFSSIIFQQGKKDIELFKPFISKANSKSTIIIGDRVRSEIEIGNRLKMTTIWVKQGKFLNELPINNDQKPSFTVRSLFELSKFFSKLK